jgi:HEAT repeat protein
MVRFHAVETLGKIHVEPSRVVPALRDMLHDPDSFVRSGVVEALGEFGADAKIATPALVEFLNEPQNSMFRRWAIDAIDPAAAAKAGVK